MLGTVYRVQHRVTGEGCYMKRIDSPELNDMIDDHCMDDEHPAPYNDVGIGRSPKNDEYCGFISIEQLYEWFAGDELDMLFENGFEIVTLTDVEITATGDYQVLFKKKIPEKTKILLDIDF